MRFVVIDSGANCANRENGLKVNGVSIDIQDGVTVLRDGFEDQFGHGTAVIDIFKSNLLENNYELFVLKVFFADYHTSSEHLCAALEYIEGNVECELILISAGIRISENYRRMKKVIDRLERKNVIIVSAFDNSGAMSYPACFDNVIGVDISNHCRKKEHFFVLENSPVNVIGSDISFRVNWLNNKKNIVKGSSFTTAYIAAVVAEIILEKKDRISFKQCIDFLKERAINVICYNEEPECCDRAYQFMAEVSKAIVFPFNKEIHSLAKFEKMLCMKVVDYYEVRQSGLVGMKIKEVAKYIENEKTIKDYEQINWEDDFDTVILGHIEQLSGLLHNDLAKWFVEKCRTYKKKLYLFDDIEAFIRAGLRRDMYFIPAVKKRDALSRSRGKQYLISKPVLGIYGTSSRQGKYTLQLKLRELFLKDGYKVAQIGTEPTGYLFGFDYVYPMGYNSAVYVDRYEAVSILNEEMHRCEEKDPDIIITGGQSQTAPRINYNISHYNLGQTEFILGTQPDIVILCINLHDDIEYVDRTIKFIEGICRCKVIGCCLYPKRLKKVNGAIKRNIEITEEDYVSYKTLLYEKTQMLLYRLDCEEEIAKLYELIINSLT